MRRTAAKRFAVVAGGLLLRRLSGLRLLGRATLRLALLETAAWGSLDPLSFPWLTAPDPARVREAVKTLKALGALTPGGAITREGKVMLTLPAHPRLARMLLEASAVLHDIGIYISPTSHHKHSFYLVNASEILRLSSYVLTP